MELGKSWRRKITLLLTSIAFLGVVNYAEAASSSALEELSTCQPFSERKVIAAALEAADLVGINHRHLLGLLVVETRFGKHLGEPAGVLGAKPDRDLVPLIALARELGFDPFLVCASEQQKGGYGGALGPAQILPSMFLKFGGLEVKDQKHYKRLGSKTLRLSAGGVRLSQRILNLLSPSRPPIVVDGVVGTETVGRVHLFQQMHMQGEVGEYSREGSPCLGEIRRGELGRCTRLALLDKVRWQLKYHPEKDRITPLLGGDSKIPNPWDLRTSLVTSALFLKDLGVNRDPQRAFGSYFAGPRRAYSRSGVEYARRVQRAIDQEVPKLLAKL